MQNALSLECYTDILNIAEKYSALDMTKCGGYPSLVEFWENK